MADVSVVIPCYNGEAFIGQTIESVLGQTDVPLEILVIDDGSTDGSVEVVQGYVKSSGGRVISIRQENAGESKARNVGINRAKGKYVAFLDADDYWLPEKTAEQLRVMDAHPGAAGVHSRVFNFRVELDDLNQAETEKTKDNPSVEELIRYHWIAPSSLMVRRKVLERLGIRFDETIRHSEDMLFVAELRVVGSLRLADALLVAKRVHGGQQSKNPWHTIYSMENRVKWCRAHQKELGEEVYSGLDEWAGGVMVQTLEDRYWRRQLRGYRDAKRRVAALYPKRVAASKVANRVIWPGWFYWAVDKVTGHR